MMIDSLFVIGGARSGKSRYAQCRAEATGLNCVYVATAQALDGEMRDRIAHHRAERGARWETVEAPLDLAAVIAERADPGRVLLVDCLTLWTTNLLLAERDIPAATDALVGALRQAAGSVILVSNEVGFGIVPDNPLARRFRDAAGIVNQTIAATCADVRLLVAGIPMTVK
jgi:adenosylcobinamide kinase/adenosylcobinamide-phosphate guanylyltransferase